MRTNRRDAHAGLVFWGCFFSCSIAGHRAAHRVADGQQHRVYVSDELHVLLCHAAERDCLGLLRAIAGVAAWRLCGHCTCYCVTLLLLLPLLFRR